MVGWMITTCARLSRNVSRRSKDRERRPTAAAPFALVPTKTKPSTADCVAGGSFSCRVKESGGWPLGAAARMAAGKVRGRAVGRHVWLRRSLPQKRGGVEPHGDDETRVRRARCRPRADICVWPAAAVLSARANPALINWQVNFTSDPDNLLHISDESAASEGISKR